MNTTSTAEYYEQIYIAEVLAKAEESHKPYAFMLPNPTGPGFILESRYKTGPELDNAVGEFASEFRGECDGHAPINGKDFLAVKIEKYELTSESTEPDWDQIAEERREGAASTA